MPAGSMVDAGQPRASSVRYGVAGAVRDTIIQTGIDAYHGEAIDGAEFSQDVAVNATVATIATRATDALTPRLGMVRSGGAVGGAIQATVSGYSNYQAYSDGEIGLYLTP